MYTTLIAWIAMGLEALILFRGLTGGLLKKYNLFYAYIGCIALADIFLFCCLKLAPDTYPTVYWPTRLLTNLASYAVALEIFRQALRHNEGLARKAQKLLIVVLVIALSFAASDLLYAASASVHAASAWVPRITADAGRYLLYIEGALLFAMLWLFGRYRISFGRNLLGLTVGYSLLVGLDVMNFALLAFSGYGSSIGLRKLIPITYIVTLSLWCASLWSAQPEPMRPEKLTIERDYELLATKTRAAFAQISGFVLRTPRT